MEAIQVISLIPYIIQNPNLIGFILFVICFLPLLAYVVRKADKQADRQQEFFNKSMDDAKVREERLGDLVNNTLAKQTEALNNINNTMVCLNQNVGEIKERVDDIEDRIGSEKERAS
ncbi:hypothetical protein HSX37_05565|uniref:Uncharacterized protein n=1 Tax=Dendrosporobacter quercicolus TaxID=146817 RepID=A0A1G9P1F0_9FIRM|nr:hypothetical protein [Dendrosporobacter quercicolus]NSL47510.1 hypothetical protein [Dendrosporobacter quercicolus DSM 1736]SDL92373.1 hypothetical protein SAMN04488502_1011190 [Dendrosporobacter quercicolus]